MMHWEGTHPSLFPPVTGSRRKWKASPHKITVRAKLIRRNHKILSADLPVNTRRMNQPNSLGPYITSRDGRLRITILTNWIKTS
jgi:hypothetical protein